MYEYIKVVQTMPRRVRSYREMEASNNEEALRFTQVVEFTLQIFIRRE